jgi:hypothetical protein
MNDVIDLFEQSNNSIGADNLDHNSNNRIRTSDDRLDTTSDAEGSANTLHKNNHLGDAPNVNIYRYKFTDDFTAELFIFSKVHQYDHRKDFKDAWNLWLEDNDDVVNAEIRRLINLGYEGNIMDKMFKSARYYFRKKSTEKKKPSKRRIYVGSQKEFLEEMDDHIKSRINLGICKPSDGFDDFCKENMDLLKEQVSLLLRSGITDSNEIKAKIKKTYKNRYFLITNKNM